MQTIRSFIAIPLSVEVRRTAVRLIERLRQEGDGIKWVPTDNLHLTLKFLGEVDNTGVPALCDRLHRVAEQYEPFELVFLGTGGFPDTERPRVLWAGVQDDSGSLCQMVAQLESELAQLGFKPEPRDYRPHLTLGRTRSGSRRASADVVARIQAESKARLGKFQVDKLQLFASFLDKGGPTYQVMDTIEL
jgi:2'-5' RNA ligase